MKFRQVFFKLCTSRSHTFGPGLQQLPIENSAKAKDEADKGQFDEVVGEAAHGVFTCMGSHAAQIEFSGAGRKLDYGGYG